MLIKGFIFLALLYFRLYGFRPHEVVFRPYLFHFLGLLVSALQPNRSVYWSQTFGHPIFIYSVVLFRSNVPASFCHVKSHFSNPSFGKTAVLIFFPRPKEGLKFLEDTVANWEPRAGLTQHMWWHKALFNISLQNYEAALTIFDEKIRLGAQKGNQMVID